MSDVASLDLCKELYELSGWGDDEIIHFGYREDGTVAHFRVWPAMCPAYDLGYLVKKLPSPLVVHEPPQCFVELKRYGEPWVAMYRQENTMQPVAALRFDSLTPEDAAAKLCIELFKQGILRVEGKK